MLQFAGWPELAFRYIIKTGGLNSEKVRTKRVACSEHLVVCRISHIARASRRAASRVPRLATIARCADRRLRELCFDTRCQALNVLRCSYCNTSRRACEEMKPHTAKISNWAKVAKDENEIAARLVQQARNLSVCSSLTCTLRAATGPAVGVAGRDVAAVLQLGHIRPRYGDCVPASLSALPFTAPGWCSQTAIDHAVLITGYGVNGTSPYWVTKNSWGDKYAIDLLAAGI